MTSWRPAPGFETLYEVSDLGAVRSVPRTLTRANGRKHTVGGQVLADHQENGYRTVSLYTRDETGKRHTHSVPVHRLVLIAFRGDRSGEGLVCRHLDDDKMNTALTNLEWGTAAENAADAVRNGVHPESRKTHCPLSHPLVVPNLMPTQLARGKRNCLSCSRGRAAVRHAAARGEVLDLQETTDRYFRKLSGM